MVSIMIEKWKINDFLEILRKEYEVLQKEEFKNQINYVHYMGMCSAAMYLFDLDSPEYATMKELLNLAQNGRNKVIDDILSHIERR